jgi:WD40 repeat protein
LIHEKKLGASHIILGMLLLSLAGVAFYVWPMGPRWSIDCEETLGFDLNEGLLYTISNRNSSNETELHGFDLRTGQYKVSFPLSNNGEAKGPRTVAILSADGSRLAVNFGLASWCIYDVHKNCQYQFTVNGWPSTYATLSPKGSLFALQDGDHVRVWDCRTGKMRHQLSMPAGMTSPMLIGYPFDKYLSFSEDERYLAVSGDDGSIAVNDLSSELYLGQRPKGQMALFRPDNKTLITMPGLFHPGKYHWHQIDGDKLISLPTAKEEDSEQENLMAGCPLVFLTFPYTTGPDRKLPGWMPDMLRDKLDSLLGWPKTTLTVKSFDVATGKKQNQFLIRVRNSLLSQPRLSSDGLLLATEDEYKLSLWDITPQRSATSWLVCSSLALFAMWLGYPRRLKVLPPG